MKILLVNKFHYRRGGSETYYFALADALKKAGHEVVFFAMKHEKNLPCEQEEFFVANSAVEGGIKSKLNMVVHIAYSKESYVKMKELLLAEKPDLVILNLVHKQITLSIIDAIKEYDADLPIFWTMHDLIAVCPSYTMLDGKGEICEKCLGGNFQHCLKNKCIRNSLLMSFLSKFEAEYIRKKKWYEQVDLFICPSDFYKNKLTFAKFTKSPIVTLRNLLPPETEYKLSEGDDDYILYFGRLSREKGIRTLIDAAKQIKCKLVILGTGPIEDELKDYVGNNPDIEFKGFQTGKALVECVKKSHCVVLPSEWYENGPYSAMEAMACGKPLIVSDNGGLPELVENGKNGYIYENGTMDLAKCIDKLLSLSDEEYKNMALNSLERAEAMFSAEKYVSEIERFYDMSKNKTNG